MHARSRLLNWGVFLIVLGAIALAVQSQVITAETAGAILRWWPLLLIVIGLGILLSRTPFGLLGGVLVAATAGVFVGALIVGGIGGFNNTCAGGSAGGELTTRNGTFGGGVARVQLELTCVDLALDRQPGSDWRLDYPAEGRQPSIDAVGDRLSVRSQDVGFFGGAKRSDWHVALPQAAPLEARLTLNASRGQADLGGGPLSLLSADLNASDVRLLLDGAQQSGPLNLTLNASSVTLSLPAGGTTTQSTVTLNASSLTLCAAPSLNLEISAHETLGSNNFGAAGLTQAGERWQTSGLSPADPRIALNITSNVSSITLDRSGGCQ